MGILNRIKRHFRWETPAGSYYELYKTILEKSSHIAIAGATGSGKSVLIRELIYPMLYDFPSNINFYLIDPKRVDLNQYNRLPHCTEYTDTDQGADELLKKAVSEMDRRYKTMKRNNINEWSGATTYIIIDECADLLSSPFSKSIKQNLITISRLGRAAKIKLIMATQAPSRKTLPAEIIQNCDRIALRCFDAIESRQILGMKGAEELPEFGRAILRLKSKIYPFKVNMTENEEFERVIKHWLDQC